jgi:hypothetical protein
MVTKLQLLRERFWVLAIVLLAVLPASVRNRQERESEPELVWAIERSGRVSGRFEAVKLRGAIVEQLLGSRGVRTWRAR